MGAAGWVSFSLKFTTFNYSFNGFRIRTCYARPRIIYILFREDRLILRKESPAKFFFFPEITKFFKEYPLLLSLFIVRVTVNKYNLNILQSHFLLPCSPY